MPTPLTHWQPSQQFALTVVADNLWLARQPVVFYGFNMVTCMSIVRCPSGQLFVHSPIALTLEMASQIAALGNVSWVVAPNRLHHLHALSSLQLFPEAKLFVAPGLVGKNPAFSGYPIIPTGSHAPWADAIDSVFVEGNTELNETVFFHRESRTLLITDLAVFLGPWDSFGTRSYARLNRCYHRFGHSFLLKTFFRDKDVTRRSFAQVMAWDFTRIVLAHGPVIETDAKAAFAAAFSWLLR